MANQDLSSIEANALADAGDRAGAYLQRIGKTDMATLEPIEWQSFLKTVLRGFEEGMRLRVYERLNPAPQAEPKA